MAKNDQNIGCFLRYSHFSDFSYFNKKNPNISTRNQFFDNFFTLVSSLIISQQPREFGRGHIVWFKGQFTLKIHRIVQFCILNLFLALTVDRQNIIFNPVQNIFCSWSTGCRSLKKINYFINIIGSNLNKRFHCVVRWLCRRCGRRLVWRTSSRWSVSKWWQGAQWWAKRPTGVAWPCTRLVVSRSSWPCLARRIREGCACAGFLVINSSTKNFATNCSPASGSEDGQNSLSVSNTEVFYLRHRFFVVFSYSLILLTRDLAVVQPSAFQILCFPCEWGKSSDVSLFFLCDLWTRAWFFLHAHIYIFGTYIFVELDVLTTADVIDILCERCFSILLVQFSWMVIFN